MTISRLLFIFVLVVLAVSVQTAGAQTSGTITGSVADASQAVMPGVKVVAVNQTTGDKRETTTNATGQYSFPFLPPGEYELQFSAQGFGDLTRKATLNVTERISVDAVMGLSSATTTIDVNASSGMLQTESAALGRVLDDTAIRQLPLSSRNFTQLLTLSPGTSAPLNDAGALGRGTQNISSGGGRTVSNAIFIDGLDAINVHTNAAGENSLSSNGVIVPSPEALQEFKVQTGLGDAQLGRSGGASVAVVTKSGSAQFHGSAFEFFRNEHLNANLFFFNATGQPRPVLKQNQFGATLGGPVARNKTFFFFSYQGTRQRNGLNGSSSLALPQIPLDRSAASLGKAFAGQKGARGGAVAVAGDGSNINPVALALLNTKLPNGQYVIPSPQSTAAGTNYAVSVPALFTEDQYITNIDHQFTDNNRLAFKSLVSAQPTYRPFPDANVPGFGVNQDFKSRLFGLNDTHTFSSSLVNEARFGLVRLSGGDQLDTIIKLADVGMQRFNSAYFADIPRVIITGAATFGYNVDADQATVTNTWQFGDTLSWVHGAHEIRGGVEGRRYQDNYYNNNRARGTLTAQTFPDFLLGLSGAPVAQGGNGTGYSNINSASVASGVVSRADRMTDVALFLQDNWKVSSRLSLTYGLRWEFLGMPVDKYGRDGTFDPRRYQAPPAGGSTSSGFVQTSNSKNPVPGLPKVAPNLLDGDPMRNFAPRFGFAYKLTQKIALRGGYGLYYDRLANQIGLREALSAPNYLRTDLSGAANINSSLQNPFPVLPLPPQFPVVPTLYAPPYTTDRPALALNAINMQMKTPYMQQWGFNTQWETVGNVLVEVGYAGTKGTRLPTQRQSNEAILASPSAPVNGITTNTAANAQNRVPYIGFSPSGFEWLETSSNSLYNSLQASATKRLSHGLRMLASYTFSKSIDNHSGSSTAVFTDVEGDPGNLHSNRGLSDFDRPHRFVFNFGYDIPNWGFRWKNTAVGKRLFGGWQIAGVAVIQSGTPFSVVDTSGAAFYGVTSSRASFAPGSTLETAQLSGRTEDRLNAYFNTKAFTAAGNLFGDSGRNVMRGPRQRNVDFSINKMIPVRERMNLEWRSEFFNVLNMVNFSTPGATLNSSTFGIIRSTQGNPRVIQFALKLRF